MLNINPHWAIRYEIMELQIQFFFLLLTNQFKYQISFVCCRKKENRIIWASELWALAGFFWPSRSLSRLMIFAIVFLIKIQSKILCRMLVSEAFRVVLVLNYLLTSVFVVEWWAQITMQKRQWKRNYTQNDVFLFTAVNKYKRRNVECMVKATAAVLTMPTIS